MPGCKRLQSPCSSPARLKPSNASASIMSALSRQAPERINRTSRRILFIVEGYELMYRSLMLAALLLASASAAATAQTARAADAARLLRFPDIHGDVIAFVYAGDIWTVPAGGGTARRLTSHPGLELFPKFSPDGRWIAFTGEYDGTRQVYVISVDGGEPRQPTFHNDIGEIPPRGGIDNQVMDWSPDGKSVLFNAHRLPMSD